MRKRRKAEFTPEERRFILDLLRESRDTADRRYASRAAGFWLTLKRWATK